MNDMVYPKYGPGVVPMLFNGQTELKGASVKAALKNLDKHGALIEFRIGTEDPDIYIVLGAQWLYVGDLVTLINITEPLKIQVSQT